MEIVIALAAVVIVLMLVGFVLLETSVIVEPGTIALLLKRGKATGRALPPGRHFIQPWRKAVVQIYPSRELTLVAGGRAIGDPRVEYFDDPLRLYLGDKAFAQMSYTLRCQLDVSKLKDVHNQFGPEGLWAALRDVTRGAILSEVAARKLSVDDVYGEGFTQLEQRLTDALGTALGAAGFELKMFTLREVDLGETGEVIQSIVRAETELERENAFAKVRKARLENDAAVSSLLAGIDGDVLLRYRQIESWRDILHRWDGDQPIPSALTVPLTAGPMPLVSSDTHVIDAEESADAAAEQQ
jgi:regulator of protease activity HflC (stomatin/prohibitin superfamily)